MKQKFAFLIILIIVMVIAPGCTMPLPTCPTADLQQVTLTGPAHTSVVDSLNPTLQWTYPSASCNPQGYAITLWEGPVLTENIGGGTGNPSTSWGPGSPLQPGKQYRWTVAPINDTTLGPVSETFIFFTGPACTAASLIAPVLVQPIEGGSFNEATDQLWWDHPAGCTPGGYQVDISEDPSFSGPNLGSSFDIPLTRLQPAGPFVDCQIYYWRVAAKVGGSVGPFSATRSFIRDPSGTCGGPGGIPPASASISGIVWHDLCAVPDGPAPSPLPTGCVADGTSMRANGIREAGEPGIAGVQVDLHWGGCATTSVASVLTDASGHYVFDGLLAFGSYCLAIRPLNPPNDSILIPGEWTFPYGLSGADAFANAMVDSGTILTDKDFGWDYQFLPAAAASSAVTATPTPASAAAPKFVFEKNAFCRKGPGLDYSDVTAIPAGDTVDIHGISPDKQWLYIFWAKFNESCWVSLSTGHTVGDLINLTIFTPAPTTVPSAIPPTKVPTKVPTATNQGKP
jgi:hypothetical protein